MVLFCCVIHQPYIMHIKLLEMMDEGDQRDLWLLQTLRWIEDIASNWEFRRIIPAHFAAPVPATPQDLRC